MTDEKRSIELEIEVQGTPEEVWQAIATGPGISSWYVPHTVEEKAGGAMSASFGPGPEMQVNGRVAEWDPPRRMLMDGGEGVEGLAFEWFVEAKDGGSCIVRLVNSGFGNGDPWDDQYDAMREGWKIFLANLALHCEHFRGEVARPSLPMAMVSGSPEERWQQLTHRLGLPSAFETGDQLTVTAPDGSSMAGSVVGAMEGRYVLVLVSEPVRGTAFIAAEAYAADAVGLSIWTYLYGEDGAAFSEANETGWHELLTDL